MLGGVNIIKWLPKEKSKEWIKIFFIATIILTLVLNSLVMLFLQGSFEFDLESVVRLLLLASILSLVISISGYFGAQYIMYITTLGIVIGLGSMIYFYNKDLSGWEGLVGAAVFIQVAAAGFGVGILTEVGIYLYQRFKK